MKKLLFILAFSFAFGAIQAQQEADKEAIIKVVKTLFDAYRAQDSSIVRPLFHPQATMGRAVVDENGNGQWRQGSVESFVSFLGTKSENYYDERIYSYDVTIDGPLATVWTEFSFFMNEKFSHCGYNVFQMMKMADGWKITNITDTSRKTGCKTE